ncbi:mettl14 [Scenedesmus sp. PABB004]|nr:mettl14 [Scenedesmus sp. PABB004]
MQRDRGVRWGGGRFGARAEQRGSAPLAGSALPLLRRPAPRARAARLRAAAGGEPADHSGGYAAGPGPGSQQQAAHSGSGGDKAPRGGAPKRHERANDYCQHYVDTGQRPQNFLRDSELEDRYADYPHLQRLAALKDKQVRAHTTPPYALRADLRKLQLSKEVFGTKFDVVLIDPPWEEYARRAPGLVADPEVWTWQEIQALNVGAIADVPSAVFLWCGSAEGLDAGRHCLRRWGFRRVEDICWVKTNKDAKARTYLNSQEPGSMLVHTKEHCLVGLRGAVKREVDGHILHANCDVDVIVSEEPPLGSTEKPDELYGIIERFVNGRRRLELFGEDHNVREGWVTVGRGISQTTFKKQVYAGHFRSEGGVPYDEHRGAKPPPGAPVLVPSTAEIEALRLRLSNPHNDAGRFRAR